MVHFIHNENSLLAHVQLSVHCDPTFSSAAALAACTGAWLCSTACVPFALLITLCKVSVASVFQAFPKGLLTASPLLIWKSPLLS